MANGNTSAANIKDQLNRASPANADAALGSLVYDLANAVNALRADLSALRTKYNAVLAKLDADEGVTDTNYAATQAMSAVTASAVTLPEAR